MVSALMIKKSKVKILEFQGNDQREMIENLHTSNLKPIVIINK